MNKTLLLAISLPFYLLSFGTQANIGRPPEPQRCPRADEIKNVGVSHKMVEESTSFWFTGRRNQRYNTSSNWTFIIAKIPAVSVDEAYGKAVDGLQSLNFDLGPVVGPVGKWLCYYHNTKGYPAVAIYPPVAENLYSQFINY